MMVTFETGTKGVPLKSLIPESDRGASFGAFPLSDYFGLAQLVLATIEDVAQAKEDPAFKAASPANPASISLAIDLDYLRLRSTDGVMDAERTAQLFEVVQAYWTAEPNTLALEPGLVATLWRRGMNAPDIIRSIRASTGRDGRLIRAQGRGYDIMSAAIEVYLEIKGLSRDAKLSQDEMGRLVKRWLTATRSVPLTTKEAGNPVLRWSDYRQLGLVDASGAAHPPRVRAVAQRIFMAERQMAFIDLADCFEPIAAPSQSKSVPSKTARATLKKKRKLGKLNRKRGRQ